MLSKYGDWITLFLTSLQVSVKVYCLDGMKFLILPLVLYFSFEAKTSVPRTVRHFSQALNSLTVYNSVNQVTAAIQVWGSFCSVIKDWKYQSNNNSIKHSLDLIAQYLLQTIGAVITTVSSCCILTSYPSQCKHCAWFLYDAY